MRSLREDEGRPGHDRQDSTVASRFHGSGRYLSCSMPAAEAGGAGGGVGNDHIEGHGPVVAQVGDGVGLSGAKA